MLLSFDAKEDLLRFITSDRNQTRYLIMGGFQRLKRWAAIPLRPLTLLYGPNSAGKGAVIDAQDLIRMLWSTNDHGNARAAVARWHRGETGAPLSVGFSCVDSLHSMYSDSRFEQYTPFTQFPPFIHELCSSDKKQESGRLTWIASWETPDKSMPTMELFTEAQRAAALLVDKNDDAELFVRRAALEKVLGGRITEFELLAGFAESTANDALTDCSVDSLTFLSWELSTLPTFLGGPLGGERVRDFQALLTVLFSSLACEGRYRSSHIGPIRRVLSTNELQFRTSGHQTSPHNANAAGAAETDGDGSDAWAELANEVSQEVLSGTYYADGTQGTSRVLAEVNRWLDSAQCFDSGYRINSDTRLVISTSLVDKRGMLKKQNILDEKATEVIVSFSLQDRQGRQHTLEDIGTGWSQVIPVIIGAFRERHGSLAFFEQPELHLHPRLQTVLCDLFIDALNHSRKGEHGVGSMIVESHSEHLLLRLQRRISETAGADIRHTRFSITPDDIAVLYFDPIDDETLIHHLRISPDGAFADRWPKGFFDERFEELFSE